MPLRVVDAVPTRGEGDWLVGGLVDRVAAMGLVSCMYVVVLVMRVLFSQLGMILLVDRHIGKLTSSK